MGNHFNKFQSGRKQYADSGLLLLSDPKHNNPTTYKPPTKRMEKLIWPLINILFPTGYGLVILLNIDNIKGVILFIIACLYGIARLFFYVVRQNQERRLRELDIIEKEREMNLKAP